MKELGKIAQEYAQKNFPICAGNAIKYDVAYHSFCDGFNEAMRILMTIGNIVDKDTRISPFNFINPIEND